MQTVTLEYDTYKIYKEMFKRICFVFMIHEDYTRNIQFMKIIDRSVDGSDSNKSYVLVQNILFQI